MRYFPFLCHYCPACGKLTWVRKDSPLSIIILCHLSARSESSGKGIRKNEQVILAHEDTTGTGHCLFQYLGLSVSVFISSMEKLAQKSDPWRNELNKKWMCTMAFQEDLFKIGHTEFTPPKAWLFREYSRYHLGRLIDVGWYETKTLMKNRINKWNRWSRHI